MAKSTRQRLIDAAHSLFYRNGFQATGLDQLLATVGVTKTTFYNHFESKDELILEVLRVNDRMWREQFADMLREHGGADPRDQLLAVFDVLDRFINSDDYHGCIFINVAVEFPNPHDPAHEVAIENKRGVEHIIRDLARRAGCNDPDAFAKQMVLLMEGTYVTKQVTLQRESAHIAKQMAQMLVEKYIPKPEPV